MGDSEITVARNYEKGAGGSFAGLDAFPMTGQYTTFALNKDGKPNYVTDSAASATGWSTGTKTYNGALGIDIRGTAQKTILELAKDQGFATGDITTSEIQDATPAALFSHISERDCYGPEEPRDRDRGPWSQQPDCRNVSEDDLRSAAEEAKLPIERVRDLMYPGLTLKLTTADSAEMTVSYGTSSDVAAEDETHTGTQVRIAAFGPRAANVVGLTDQTDLFFKMTDALGIKR